MKIVPPSALICAFLVFINGDLAVADGNNCQHLFNTTVPQQSQRIQSEFPDEFLQIVDAHPITRLSEKLSNGEGLAVSSLSHVNIDLSRLGPMGLGEVIQTQFMKKLLHYIFPKLFFLDEHTDSTERKVISLDVHDYAEYGGRLKLDIVNMAYLKSANPYQIIEGRRSAMRTKLGIEDGDRVVSLYSPNISRSKKFYSPDDIITDLLSSRMRPKIIFVSNIDNSIQKPPSFINPNSYKVLTYSDFLKNQSSLIPFDGTYIIINNTKGRMVEIYESADVAIVLGAINFFEALNVHTPTINYMDGYYLGKFHQGTFNFLADIGQRTHGYRLVDDPHDLEGAYRDALKIKREDITPSYLTKDNLGKTPLDYLLDNILKLMKDSLSTKTP